MAETDELPKEFDGIAIASDLDHSRQCAEMLVARDHIEDATVVRALWESGLISLRRALKNAQTMAPGSGGSVQKPFNQKQVRKLLGSPLDAQFDALLDLADRSVAHRQPKEEVRTVDKRIDPHSGHLTLTDRLRMPSEEQVLALARVTSTLSGEAVAAVVRELDVMPAGEKTKS